jgi:YegS/Rv2252/BmrU family lipid kinase
MTLFIYNPTAGRGLIRQHLFDIIDILSEKGDVIVHPTRGPLDAFNAAESADDNVDLLVVSGGDGTLGEVIKGIMSAGSNVALGYIPAGTMNDFATCHSIPKNMNDAAELIVTGTPKRYDIGLFEPDGEPEAGAYFTYVAAFGAFTNVSYETSQQMKNVFGGLAYMMKGLTTLGSIKPFHMTVRHDNEEVTDDFLFGMTANSTSVGGMRGITGEDVSLNDGLFECVFLRAVPSSQIAALINAVINHDFSSPFVYSFKAETVEISASEPLPFTLDGERGGEYPCVKISCVREAINIIAGTGNPFEPPE